MSREAHVRFWESPGVRLPRATHLPLHRQQAIFDKRHGVRLPASTLGDWVAGASDLLSPVVALLKQRTLADALLHSDDTGVRVLDSNDARGIKRGHLWPYVGQGGNVFVEYTPDWSGTGPNRCWPTSGATWWWTATRATSPSSAPPLHVLRWVVGCTPGVASSAHTWLETLAAARCFPSCRSCTPWSGRLRMSMITEKRGNLDEPSVEA